MAEVRADRHRDTKALIEVGVAGFVMAGETQSGDLYLARVRGASATIAAIDGGGHGQEAARAARIAIATIDSNAGADVLELVRLCHAALRNTRGAVMGLATFDGDRNLMTWLGVGNVEGTLFRHRPGAQPIRESLSNRGGIVGWNLPHLRPVSVRISAGDLVILTTDGIAPPFDPLLALAGPPQRIAEQLCSSRGKLNDDGLAVVAEYRGCGHQ